MAIRPDYDIGTVTLVASSANFTTSGSSLQTAAVQAGDAIIEPSGHVLIIASITGQNSGTLFLPCPPDAAGTGLPLRIRFQPDGSRYQGAVRNLIDMLSSGNLEAFAALVGADGLVPIFTGPGTLDLADPATFGIQDPNGSLGKLAALTLEANKAITTDGRGNAQRSDIGALGRALLALATGNSSEYVRADGTLQTLNKAAVGLGNVDNTSDASKPISTATQTALNGKLSTSGGTILGNINLVAAWPGIDLRGTGTTVGYLDFTPNGYSEDFTWRVTTAQARWDFVIEYGGGDGYSNGQKFKVNRNGDVQVFGNLAKSSGTFLIDHPKNPLNKNLRHGFVEAPEYLNIYRGVVDLEDGRMSVDIDAAFGMSDGTFAALNVEVCAFLQTQFGPERVWLEGPADSGKFTIISENPQSSAAIAFMVTGRRNDPYVVHLDPTCERGTGRFIPEFDKPIEGKYDDADGNKADY